MKQPSKSQIVHIRLRADKGSEVYACVEEALVMAINEGVPVVVEHNGREFTAYPQRIRDLIMEQATKSA